MKFEFEKYLLMTLASPLIAYQYIKHFYEQILKINGNTNDKLFMRRFNLIDSQHVDDLIEWNNEYRRKRETK